MRLVRNDYQLSLLGPGAAQNLTGLATTTSNFAGVFKNSPSICLDRNTLK